MTEVVMVDREQLSQADWSRPDEDDADQYQLQLH